MNEFPEYAHSLRRTKFGSYKWSVYHCGTLVLNGKNLTEDGAFRDILSVITQDRALSKVSMRKI